MTEAEYSDEELQSMWEAYVSNGRTDVILRETLAVHYYPLVRRFVARQAMKSPADRHNLESWAAGGLLRAIDNYDPFPPEGYVIPVSFRLYLTRSMQSVMMDGVRKEDFAPRSLRKRQRTLETCRAAMRQELGRNPTDFEVADRLGMDVHTIQQTDAEVKNSWIDYIEDNTTAQPFLATLSERHDPHDENDVTKRLREALAEEVARLAPLHRTVIVLIHFEEMRTPAVALAIGISESHVRTVYAQAVAQCHEAMMRSMGVTQLPL